MQKILSLIYLFILTSCASGGYSSLRYDSSAPKRVVKVLTSDSTLKASIASEFTKTGMLVAASEDSAGEFTLIIDKLPSAGSSVPHIVGVLRKAEDTDSLKLGWQLLDFDGKKLHSGEALGLGGKREVFIPALEKSQMDATSNDKTVLAAAVELSKQVATNISKTKWSNPILARESIAQVSIVANRNGGLKEGQKFSVVGDDGTKLKLTHFAEAPFYKAYLVLEKGTLPNAGDVIYFVE